MVEAVFDLMKRRRQVVDRLTVLAGHNASGREATPIADWIDIEMTGNSGSPGNQIQWHHSDQLQGAGTGNCHL